MSCNEWKEYTLDEISINYNTKRKPLSSRERDGRKGIYPYYGAQGIIDYIDDYMIDGEYILIAEDGNNLKERKEDIARIAKGKFWVNNHAHIIKNNKLSDMRFLKYYINNIDISSYITGSAQPKLNKANLGKLKILAPQLELQEKIANILSSLDDKIELNNEMNKTLEEMAQSIFKRWFIDFEFPNEDGQPYKSSGGEMVDSGLGMIPNGWEVKSIYELAEYINGTSFKSKDYSDVGLPIIKIAELKNGITDSTKFFYGEKDQKFYLKNRDILFSWSGNPDTSIDTFIWDKGDAILNQHIFKVIPKFDNGYAFTYLMLKYLKSTFTHIARNKQTTGLGHVTVKDLKELKIALCFDKIKEFNKIVEPIVDLIFENNINTKLLNETRDGLLPKLMSGEIRVN